MGLKSGITKTSLEIRAVKVTDASEHFKWVKRRKQMSKKQDKKQPESISRVLRYLWEHIQEYGSNADANRMTNGQK